MQKQTRVIILGSLFVAGAVVLTLTLVHHSTETKVSTATSSQPAPQGVDGITASQFTARGIYLGPPGVLRAGVPTIPPPTVATTAVLPGESTPSSVQMHSPEQLAVMGDPANGSTKVTASDAVAVALKNIGGFVGPATAGTPVLVQFDSVNASVLATAWAMPISGKVELSGGPVPTGGGTVTITPYQTTVIVFVDGTTGMFMEEDGFGS